MGVTITHPYVSPPVISVQRTVHAANDNDETSRGTPAYFKKPAASRIRSVGTGVKGAGICVGVAVVGSVVGANDGLRCAGPLLKRREAIEYSQGSKKNDEWT